MAVPGPCIFKNDCQKYKELTETGLIRHEEKIAEKNKNSNRDSKLINTLKLCYSIKLT